MKNLFVLIAMGLFLQSGYSQIGAYNGQVGLGLTADVQMAKFNFSEDFQDTTLENLRRFLPLAEGYHPDGRASYAFGGVVSFNVGSSVGILIKVGFARDMIRYQIPELLPYPGAPDAGIYIFEENLNIVQINPAIRIQPFDSYSGPFVAMGPTFGVGVSGKEKAYFDTGKDTPTLIGEARDVKFGEGPFKNYRSLSVGMSMALGWAFYVNENTRITAEIQRQVDFSNLYTDSRVAFLDNRIRGTKSFRATALSIGVEYIIPNDK